MRKRSRSAAAALLAGVVLTALYFISEWLIRMIYEGNAPPFLEQLLMTRKHEHPLSYYQSQVKTLLVLSISTLFFIWTAASRWERVSPSRRVFMLFGLLLAGDLSLLWLHFRFPVGSLFDAGRDWGVLEGFDYLKEIGAAAVFLVFYRRERRWVDLAFFCLLSFMFFDDALKYHEIVGSALEGQEGLSRAAGFLRTDAEKMGELISLAPYFLIFLPVLVMGYLRSDQAVRHRVGVSLVFITGIFLFGVVLNYAEALDFLSSISEQINLAENAGTSIFLSGFAAYLFSTLQSARPAPPRESRPSV